MKQRLFALALLVLIPSGLISVEDSASKTQKDKDEELFNACRGDDPIRVKRLIERGSNPNATKVEFGEKTPLLVAIEVGSPKIVEALLESGADPKCGAAKGKETPLHLAAQSGVDSDRGNAAAVEIMRLLTKAGADPNAVAYESSPLSIAAQRHPARMQFLLDHGAHAGFRELAAAIRWLQMEPFELLLSKGAKPDALLPDRRTLLHQLASAHGSGYAREVIPSYLRKALDRLLELGVPVNAKDSEGMTALHYSAQGGDIELATWLLEHHADVNAKDMRGVTPLLKWAGSYNKRKEMMKLLLANGADPTAMDADGHDLFEHLAGEARWEDVFEMLDSGLKPASPETLIFNLARQCGEASVASTLFVRLSERLVPMLKDPDMVDDEGLGFISWSVRAANEPTLKYLLKRKLKLNVPDRHGRTPLIWAVLCGNERAAELLRDAGAKASARDDTGRTAGDYEKLIKSKWAAPALGQSDGGGLGESKTTEPEDIFTAVWRGDLKLLKVQASEHPELMSELRYGLSPIMLAAALGHGECFDFLARTGDGVAADLESPASLAMRNGHAALAIAWLQREGKAAKPKEISAVWSAGYENQQWRAVRDMLDAGIPPGDMAWSLLCGAARASDAALCRKLLDLGAPVLKPEHDPCNDRELDRTPNALVAAIIQKDVKLAKLIALRLAAEPSDGRQAALNLALCEAATYGNLPMVKMLLSDTAASPDRLKKPKDDPFATNPRDALASAVKGGNLDIVQMLVAKGARPVKEDGDRLLMEALSGSHVDIFEFLWKNGANPVDPAANGDTSLHGAARLGKKSLVERLLAAGANPTLKTQWGQTPSEVAASNGFTEIEKLLIKAAVQWTQKHPIPVTSPAAPEASQTPSR